MKTDLLIVGTGALATFFAYRLSEAGVDVRMLGSWKAGLAALRDGGARLEGGGIQAIQVSDNPTDCRGARLALVLVKSWQTERAAIWLKECLAENGLAVTLQNGLGNDAILSRIIGSERVSRGVTTYGATLVAPGLVCSGGEGEVILEACPLISSVEKMMRVANISTQVVENAEPLLWGKLVVNAAINPLTALLRVKNGDLLDNPFSCSLMVQLAQEAASVAHACGVELPFSDPKLAVESVARQTADNTSSMLQDILRGDPTEVDAINGAIIQKGASKMISTPVNRVICSLVKALPVHGKILIDPPVGGD